MKKILVLLCVMFSISNVWAIEEIKINKIGLNEALELAEKNNLELQSSKLNLEAQKNNIKIMGKFQNPDFGTFFNLGTAGQGNPQQIGVNQVVELGKIGARKKFAKTNLEIAKKVYKLDEFSLKMDVRKTYVNLVASKTVLSILEEQRKLLEELVRIAKKRVEVGVSAEIDVLQAEIALNQMATQINSARSEVEGARYNFNKTLNLKDYSEIYDSKDELLLESQTFTQLLTPSAKSKLPSFNEIADMALEKRHDLKIAKQGIELAKNNLSVVIRQRIPDIALTGGYLYQSADDANNYTHQNGGFVGMGLTNIPIFYNYSPEIKNAKIQIEQAQLNYNSAYNYAINDIGSSYEKFVSAKLNLNYYNENLIKKSDELIKISKKSYEVGKANLTSLIVMEQSYQAIRTGYVLALAQYYNSWINFLTEVNDEEFKLNEPTL